MAAGPPGALLLLHSARNTPLPNHSQAEAIYRQKFGPDQGKAAGEAHSVGGFSPVCGKESIQSHYGQLRTFWEATLVVPSNGG